jgi:hypothetical protein
VIPNNDSRSLWPVDSRLPHLARRCGRWPGPVGVHACDGRTHSIACGLLPIERLGLAFRALPIIGRIVHPVGSFRPDSQAAVRQHPVEREPLLLQPGEERDPDLLETWREGAMHFTLSEGETHALDLKLSSF